MSSSDKLPSNAGLEKFRPGYSQEYYSRTTSYELNIPKLIFSIFLTLFLGIVIAFIIAAISRYSIYATQYMINLWYPYSILILISSTIFIVILHFLPLRSILGKFLIWVLIFLDMFLILGGLPALLIYWFFSSYNNSTHIAMASLATISSILLFVINWENFPYFIHKLLFFLGIFMGAYASVKLLL